MQKSFQPKNNQAFTNQTFKPKALVLACALAMAGSSHAATDLSGVPLFALEGLSPNITLTIDDSGSMSWAAVPDSKRFEDLGLRWRSHTYNAMYYNPNNRYPAPPDENGVQLSTSFTNAYLNGFNTTQGSRDLANNYQATRIFDPANASHTIIAAPDDLHADYGVFDSSNTDCDGTIDDNDCYDRVIVSSTSGPATVDINNDGVVNASDKDERQNFANWYSFYRTRNLATMSGASTAFSQLDPDVRVAFQSINKCQGFSTTCKDSANVDYDSRIATFAGAKRENFIKWLQRTPASGGTPLLQGAQRTGAMYETDRPYEKDPGVTVDPQYECRGNFSIVMTDGIWNNGLATVGESDNTAGALPDGVNYNADSPYASAQTDNLADVAMHYWAKDLSGLPNSPALAFMPVKSNEVIGTKTFSPYWNPRNDPATWQHMVTFTIGLGLSSWLGTDWGGSTFATASGAFPQFADGSRAWPATGNNSTPGNVYDLWHAAINGRGGFYSAESPGDVVKAFDDIIKGILDRKGSAVAASISNPNLNAGVLVYQTEFNTTDWTGNMFATAVSDGNPTPNTSGCDALPAGSLCPTHTWEAQPQLDLLNWNTGRKIITNVDGSGKPFRWNDLNATQQADLTQSDVLGQQRLEYLRGNRSEETNGSNGKPFRERNHVMGDIINSAPAPLFVGEPNFYYPNDATYTAFQSANAARTKVVYVGGNDGMLHAFNANTGAELLGFVPNAVFPNLHKLTATNYSHQSYVDGAMIHYDLKIGGTWKTYLFAGLGLGGKSIYALDITNPGVFNEASANSIFKWEFTDPDLGYTYGKPKVVNLRIGGLVKPYVVFGSGFTDGMTKAALYIVDAATGALVSRVEVNDHAGALNFTNNGLIGITPVDTITTAADKLANVVVTDAVYAGDLYGNMWKFDFTGVAPKVAFGTAVTPEPWFVAKDSTGARQPITTEPSAIRHPTRNGSIIYFGTGKYLGSSDTLDNQTQTMYAVWDKESLPSNAITRDVLLQQQIRGDNTSKFTATDARITTNCAITWHDTDDATMPGSVGVCGTGTYDPSNNNQAMGWFIDLNTEAGERVHQAPIVRGDRVIFVTVTPSLNPCAAGGASWIYEFQANSGSRLLTTTPFDYNQDGLFNGDDYVADPVSATTNIPASGIRFDGAGVMYLDKESIISGSDREFKMGSSSTGTVINITESTSTSFRRTWREVTAE